MSKITGEVLETREHLNKTDAHSNKQTKKQKQTCFIYLFVWQLKLQHCFFSIRYTDHEIISKKKKVKMLILFTRYLLNLKFTLFGSLFSH